MKAIVYYEFGGPEVLRVEEIARPVPAETQVLLRVGAASLNPLDWRMLRMPAAMRLLFGEKRPSAARPGQIGHDVAGVVEAVGAKVTQWRPGDEVFGTCEGAVADYACAAEAKLAKKPANVTFEEAAAVPIAGMTALQGLRDHAKVRPGHRVLINGAAGGVGTFAVQVGKELGAEVTGVCSTRNVEMVRALGAERVIDYTREDFTRSGERYDAILDCVGNRSPAEYRRVLKAGGVGALAGAPKSFPRIGAFVAHAVVLSWFTSQKQFLFMARIATSELEAMAELMQAGKVRAIIDRRYAIGETPEAMRYLEEGHARGKVVIGVGA